MIPMFQNLAAHMAWADDAILRAIATQENAWADEDIRKLLHHVVSVLEFFLSLLLQRPFNAEAAKQMPDSIDAMQKRFQATHADYAAYTAGLDETELARPVHFPIMPQFRPSAKDALMQVLMHSGHHRAQCAARLRALGGKPPVLDYILWVRDVAGK